MLRCFLVVGLLVGLSGLAGFAQETEDEKKMSAAELLDVTMQDIDGNDIDLQQYRGDVLLVVNVASRCGLTPQYAGLEALHDRFGEQGFAVLGFPCNQFGGQEPGTEVEIKQFCQSKYDVSFPMFAKIDVNGDDRCELYQRLTGQETDPVGAGDISWNFEKFLIDRSGNVVARFSPRTKPDDGDLVKAIESALKDPQPDSTDGAGK